MTRKLSDFQGKYTIQEGEGRFGIIAPGHWLCIGTGYFGDPVSDGTKIGISIFDPETKTRVLPREGLPPNFAFFVDGTLNGTSYWADEDDELQLISYQVTMMNAVLPDGGLYKAPTLRIFIGDPDNAGVWGANDNSDDPPPPDDGGG